MVSLMCYVMYHAKSDVKGFVCICVIVDRLTKLLLGLFMIVSSYYFTMHYFIVLIFIFMNFSGLSAFCRIFYINNPAFCKTNSSGKTLDTRQEILYAALPLRWISSMKVIYLLQQENMTNDVRLSYATHLATKPTKSQNPKA